MSSQPPPAQPPRAQLQQIRAKVQQILTANEVILHLAVQSTPLKPIANLTPDCVVLTNRRFIIYRPKLLGRADFEDYIWRELHDARLKEGVTRATITFQTIKGKTISIEGLPKNEARRLYAIAQEQEERMLEERRRREMEEKRAAAGGVFLHGAPVTTPSPPSQVDPVQKLRQLKDMLDAGLISQEEYDGKKADILSRM